MFADLEMSDKAKPNAAWLAAKPFVNGGLSGTLAATRISQGEFPWRKL